MSNYLEGVTDGYGLPSSLPPGLALLASDIVDSYLKRPEGLVYVCDANGKPYAMQNALPTFSYTLQAAIQPGFNVSVNVTPDLVRPDLIGEVLTIDFGNDQVGESCVVVQTSGRNNITLKHVQFAHESGAVADVGRVVTEDRNAPNKRSLVRVAKWPIVHVQSLLGRYAYGRRSDQVGGLYQELNLLAAVQTFGGPPQWLPIQVEQSSFSDSTGEIWVPAGVLLAYYSDVRIKYITGYTQANIPRPIVRATSQIASALIQTAGTPGQIKTIYAGDTRLEKFSSTIIDNDMRSLLDPFKARSMY